MPVELTMRKRDCRYSGAPQRGMIRKMLGHGVVLFFHIILVLLMEAMWMLIEIDLFGSFS